jgi:hypothetical protein
LSVTKDTGTFKGEVIFYDLKRTTEGEGKYLGGTDAEVLKRGEQIGLETRVVHAVNDECCTYILLRPFYNGHTRESMCVS